jgi:hypothetical protein
VANHYFVWRLATHWLGIDVGHYFPAHLLKAIHGQVVVHALGPAVAVKVNVGAHTN